MSESFIHELSLEGYEDIIATLDVRFMAGGSLYNGCQQECLRRLFLMRESKVYQKARKPPIAGDGARASLLARESLDVAVVALQRTFLKNRIESQVPK